MRQPAVRKSIALLLVLFSLLASVPVSAQQSEADVFVAQAILAYEDKHYDEALAHLREALAQDPKNVEALYYTGLVYVAQQRLDLAIPVLEQARQIAPDDFSVRYLLGVAYFAQERYDPRRAAPHPVLRGASEHGRPRLLRGLHALSQQELPGRSRGLQGRDVSRPLHQAADALLLWADLGRHGAAGARGRRARRGHARRHAHRPHRRRRAAARQLRGGRRGGQSLPRRSAGGVHLRQQREGPAPAEQRSPRQRDPHAGFHVAR
jgi:tetratricopeptide (TPR) repeat protein